MGNMLVEYNSGDFERYVLNASEPAIVYFYSDDCLPCISLSAMLEKMAERYGGQVRFVKLFRQKNRKLAEKYGVKNSPAVLFFRNGQEVCTRLGGYISAQELRRSIETLIAGACPIKQVSRVYCDIVILGAGPAGLSAAIYTGRAKLFTVVIDKEVPGGEAATTFHVANYPGTNGVVRGIDLMENMKKQALDFGVLIDDMKDVKEVSLAGDEKLIRTEDTDYVARSVIIATGAEPKRLMVEGEREFRGRGVHYCSVCDAALYNDANVLVVGGGNSAVEEAVFLTRYARHVTIIHQLDHFQASRSAQEEALHNPAISVMWDSEIRKINGDSYVKSVTVENLKNGEKKEIGCDGIFVYIGMQPNTDIFKKEIAVNESGYIITDEDMRTNIPGVFAVGDVRDKKVRQIASAVGDGVVAGAMVERYITGK